MHYGNEEKKKRDCQRSGVNAIIIDSIKLLYVQHKCIANEFTIEMHLFCEKKDCHGSVIDTSQCETNALVSVFPQCMTLNCKSPGSINISLVVPCPSIHSYSH